MKTLYLVRHAKSSWDNPLQSDFDRPLNDRGKKDAPRMGKRLKERELTPDLILSSPAKRAISSCKRIARAIGYPEDKIKTDKNLYHADADVILSIIQELNDKFDEVMVFGHNPGLTDFVNVLIEQAIMNVPTCGVVAARFNVEAWQDIDRQNATLLFFDFPKSKDD